MGSDVRRIPADAARRLPDQFRAAGLVVEVTQSALEHARGVMITRIVCQRGLDKVAIGVVPEPESPGECRIAIPNQGGWRASVRRRRYQLQSDVTAIIEHNGGYWPHGD